MVKRFFDFVRSNRLPKYQEEKHEESEYQCVRICVYVNCHYSRVQQVNVIYCVPDSFSVPLYFHRSSAFVFAFAFAYVFVDAFVLSFTLCLQNSFIFFSRVQTIRAIFNFVLIILLLFNVNMVYFSTIE